MTEVTYEDWQKNPTPRVMWVWDDYVEDKKKLKVLYISKEMYPVISITIDDTQVEHFTHCAEIEKQRRMTNKELARWIREKPTRELKYSHCGDHSIHSAHEYYESSADEEVCENIVIREGDGEWREPLVEE